jgi:hypothetical protein
MTKKNLKLWPSRNCLTNFRGYIFIVIASTCLNLKLLVQKDFGKLNLAEKCLPCLYGLMDRQFNNFMSPITRHNISNCSELIFSSRQPRKQLISGVIVSQMDIFYLQGQSWLCHSP